MNREKRCPLCGSKLMKIIYMGLPGRLCSNEQCNCMMGLANYAANLLWNGYVMVYQGSYWAALWGWLFDPPDDEAGVG